MSLTIREKRRRQFRAMIEERGLTREHIAGLLHVSLDTLKAWLKPETAASSNPVPEWAIELLGFKAPMPGDRPFDPARDIVSVGAKPAKAKPVKKRARA
ncbi:hypothetical protein BjapCC829_21865 [Bradyrhizobium barranii]|uniref:HTH cro/C1-type domain-containing protein n=1 Tax=Bradyrhizobium barranii TaxID=2992140 RepID=A0ABY3QYD8_9BRAD|nr:hypothetical protein [Bradyrhizobium japonicum]UFW91038.1 hypothetical protein BjapCC829_21865 [Bradyrhizobium japonicum]